MRLSEPIILRLNVAPFNGTPLSIREHLPSRVRTRPEGPLFLVTFHPGYLAGSYTGQDYFANVSSILLRQPPTNGHLRIFTVNHPGYDNIPGHTIDRFDLEAYRVAHQPAAVANALSWLLNTHLGQEKEIVWVAYGHSMGGLALSRYQPDTIYQQLAGRGRRLQLHKILSAPALILSSPVQDLIGRLEVLQMLKQTVGRLPFYEAIATSLYQMFAPIFYERDAIRYSIEAYRQYALFSHLNPFVLLEQGRELLRFNVATAGGPATLADSRVILGRRDRMIDVVSTQELIKIAQEQGLAVTQHILDSSHLLELEAPALAARIIGQVMSAATRPVGQTMTRPAKE